MLMRLQRSHFIITGFAEADGTRRQRCRITGQRQPLLVQVMIAC